MKLQRINLNPIRVRSLIQSSRTGSRDISPEENMAKISHPVLPEDSSDGEQQETQTLHITNSQSKQVLKHGQDFGIFLDPRDQVLEHDFDFTVILRNEDFQKDTFEVGKEKMMEDIFSKSHEFLVQAGSNIISAAFNFLNKKELTDNEAKQYSAKNLMLNLHSIFSQISTKIKESRLIHQAIQMRKQIKEEVLGTINYRLSVKMENIYNNILVNLADLYPQAEPTGETPRMRDAIAEINRVEDQQNDLIFANGIKIKDYVNQEGNYTSFIMKVINTAIKVTQLNEEDSRERTVKEIFTQFNEQMFWLCQDQKYQEIIKNMEKTNKNMTMMSRIGKDTSEETKNYIIDFFDRTLERNFENLENLNETMESKKQSPRDEEEGSKIIETQLDSKLLNLLKNAEQEIEFMKKRSNYALGQKIPAFVKEFSDLQLSKKEFSSKHSSIFRIMTKWAEYLNQIFENPEYYVYQRPYPFKRTDNTVASVYNKDKLVNQLKAEQKHVNDKYLILLKSCYEWMGNLLSQRENSKGHVFRYSETRVVASKINSVLTHLMLKYLNVLIHHLIRAGRALQTQIKMEDDISLIVFRVSDLLRSKLQCSETSFISLLRTMYLLDNSQKMRGKFKLVRIKNKLDDPASNIIINYLFMGKVQCQLQLSTQNLKDKQKTYYTFSHFIYELTRGKFGSLAECVIMISQLDPMIAASKGPYYAEKQVGPLFHDKSITGASQKTQETKTVGYRVQTEAQTFEKAINGPLFQCISCKKLIINQNKDLFQQEKKQRMCNDCFLKKKHPEQEFKSKNLKEMITKGIRGKWIKRIISYSEFENVTHYKPVINIDGQGHIDLYLCIFIKDQLKTFLTKVDMSVITDFENNKLDFTKLDTFDITKKIKKDKKNFKPMSEIWFFVQEFNQEVAKIVYISPASKFKDTEEKYVSEFEDFRLQKTLIKNVKFKVDVINVSFNRPKFDKLDQVIKALNENEDKSQLKYYKYDSLKLDYINTLQARQLKLEIMPLWICRCLNLKHLNLGENQIKNIDSTLLPPGLTYLDLSWNQIASPLNLSHLKRLRYLDIYNNNVSQINIQNLHHLEYVQLSKNSLKGDLILQSNEQLSQLKIEFNSLSALSLNLPNLENIILSKMTSLTMKNMKKLKNIPLQGRFLNQLELDNLPNLTQINASGNRIKKMALANLPLLQELILSSNSITEIRFHQDQDTNSISRDNLTQIILTKNQLSSITKLSLGNNELTFIEIDGLVNIKELILSQNKLKEFNCTNKPHLQVLQLSLNRLTKVELQELPCLQKINLQNNSLEQIDTEGIPYIKQLELSYNKFKQFKCLNKKNIRFLHITNNQLTSIELQELPNLTILETTNNSLTSLRLFGLPSLSRALLQHNSLTSLQIEQTPTLYQLDIRNNNIKTLTLQNLPSLIMLAVDNNPLQSVSLSNLLSLTKLALQSKSYSSLHLENLPLLEDLFLSRSKQLTVLSLNNLDKLKRLYFSGCSSVKELRELPPSIEWLWGSFQTLAKFDFEKLPKLTRLKLDEKEVERSQLTNLKKETWLVPEDKKINA